jgi:hypothetical protein
MDERSWADQTRLEGVESVSIRLADGNLWGLALPRPRIRPKVVRGVDALGRPIETIQIVTEFGYPLEIRRLIDDLRISVEQGTAESQYEALFRLAVSLIRRTHDLELLEVAGLLEMDLEDLPNFVETILSVVTGGCLATTDSPRKKQADV